MMRMTATVLRITPRSEPWLNKRQLAAHLGFSTRWVELRVGEGMPSKLWGNRRRFRVSEVESWLERRAA